MSLLQIRLHNDARTEPAPFTDSVCQPEFLHEKRKGLTSEEQIGSYIHTNYIGHHWIKASMQLTWHFGNESIQAKHWLCLSVGSSRAEIPPAKNAPLCFHPNKSFIFERSVVTLLKNE
jgi:hypothetical protein